MLKNIDPVLGPELLSTLRAMGHADEICIADANFPAASNARRLIRADGIDALRLVRAIVSVMPIDDFVPDAVFRMEVSGAPADVPPIARTFETILQDAGYKGQIKALERFAF